MHAIAAPDGPTAINEAFGYLKDATQRDASLSNIVVGVNRLATGYDRYENPVDVLRLSVLTQALILYLGKLKDAALVK